MARRMVPGEDLDKAFFTPIPKGLCSSLKEINVLELALDPWIILKPTKKRRRLTTGICIFVFLESCERRFDVNGNVAMFVASSLYKAKLNWVSTRQVVLGRCNQKSFS